MKKLQNKRGFTLIELLVVITIIGILATGGISVFTKQLQGARDTTRTTNLKLLETAANQYFSDNSEYPNNGAANTTTSGSFKTQVTGYMSKYPEDPKTGQAICWRPNGSAANGDCGAWYQVGNDSNGLRNAAFKMAIAFEKKENASGSNSPAAKDGGVNQLNGYLEVFGGVGGADFLSGAVVTATGINTTAATAKLY